MLQERAEWLHAAIFMHHLILDWSDLGSGRIFYWEREIFYLLSTSDRGKQWFNCFNYGGGKKIWVSYSDDVRVSLMVLDSWADDGHCKTHITVWVPVNRILQDRKAHIPLTSRVNCFSSLTSERKAAVRLTLKRRLAHLQFLCCSVLLSKECFAVTVALSALG